MRCLILVAALMGLTACGGELLPEETQAPVSTQEAAPAQVPSPGSGQVSADSICAGNSWECRCAQYKTSATCAGVTGCFWYLNSCQPTYE